MSPEEYLDGSEMSDETGADGHLNHNKQRTGHTPAGLYTRHSVVMATRDACSAYGEKLNADRRASSLLQ
jgi:hypothetical protein